MQEFFIYFFGTGVNPEFSLFSFAHILPPHYGLRILIIAVAITFLFCLAYLPWHLKDKKAHQI